VIGAAKPGQNSHYGDCRIKKPRLCQPLHDGLLILLLLDAFTRKHANAAPESDLRATLAPIQCKLNSMHVFESRFRVLGLQLVKSTFNTFKGLCRLRLIAFIRGTVQISY
jgi:hypothetical protein